MSTHRNRIGFRRSSELKEENEQMSVPPTMDILQVDPPKISEAHHEARVRIEALSEFIASDDFSALPNKLRTAKVNELSWLSRVEAELSAKAE